MNSFSVYTEYQSILICFACFLFLICPLLCSFLDFIIKLCVFSSGVLPSKACTVDFICAHLSIGAFLYCNCVAAAVYQCNIDLNRSLLFANFVYHLYCVLFAFTSSLLSVLCIICIFIRISFTSPTCFNQLLLTSHYTSHQIIPTFRCLFTYIQYLFIII